MKEERLNIKVVGLGWYYKEDFENIKKMFDDGERIGESYEDWLSNAEKAYDQLVASGLLVTKVYIRSKHFQLWCEKNHLEISSQSRLRFVNEIAFKKYLEDQQFEALIPIFVKHKLNGSVKQIGTGIFTYISGITFLLTAAHVINENKIGDILIPTNERLVQIEGVFSSLDVSKNKKGNEVIFDVGYFKLDVNFSKKHFNSFSKIKINDMVFVEDPAKSEFYTIAGYPSSKSSIRTRLATSEMYLYSGYSIGKEFYSKYGYDPNLHIIVKFRRDSSLTIEGEKTFPPFFRGLSGGGIFIWPDEFNDQLLPVPRKLAGIFHRYYKNDDLLVGTNIQVLIRLIAKNNPELFPFYNF